MRNIKIGNKTIGQDSPVFVIAEAGVNHNSDPEIAAQLIRSAAESGADAIKFQTYTADKLVTPTAPKYYVDTMEQWEKRDDPEGYQYDEFSIVDKLPLDAYRGMVDLCQELGIIFMSTPFDEESTDFLCDLDTPAFKIASGDITSLGFLDYVAKKKRPILLSTGCSTLGEIEEAVDVIRSAGNEDIVLLHCTLSYPSDIGDANLNMMHTMQLVFPEYPIGLSDHTLGALVPILAASHGAKAIEKHYTIDKSLPDSTDHFMSVDPGELKEMVLNIQEATRAMGGYKKEPIESEKLARMYARRSIVANRDIPEGTVIDKSDVALKRPGTGIQPKFIDIVIGRKTKCQISENTLLTWEMMV